MTGITVPEDAVTPHTLQSMTLNAKIELYKTFVETAERTIERRMRANQFYFSVIAALFIAYTYLAEGKPKSVIHVLNSTSGAGGTSPVNTATPILPLIVLPLFLLVVSLSWYMLLRNFRTLSTAKYAIINEMETGLPLQPFLRERAHYKALGRSQAIGWEMVMPVVCCLAAVFGLVVPFL